MNPSKVTISKETKEHLNNPLLTRTKRTILRRQAILDYIRSKPAGEPIYASELAEVSNDLDWTRRRKTAGINYFLKKMERDGLITMERIPHSWKSTYTIPGDARTIKTASEADDNLGDIEALAMSFAWQHPKHGNDLHKFVEWVKNERS